MVHKGSSTEDVAAFRAKVAAQAAGVKQTVRDRTGARLTAREQKFHELLWQFWEDATWMANANGFLGFYPDGRPKREQHPWHLMLWGTMIRAMVRRANRPPRGSGQGRGDGDGDDDDDGDDGKDR